MTLGLTANGSTQREKRVWRDTGGEREGETDSEEGGTTQEKPRKLRDSGGRVRVEPERNNESPLPPTKTAMSALPPPPLTPASPPSPPSLWLLLSCCHCVTVWIAFYYSTVWAGRGVTAQPTTLPPANIQTYTHTLWNVTLCAFSHMHKRGWMEGDGGAICCMQTHTLRHTTAKWRPGSTQSYAKFRHATFDNVSQSLMHSLYHLSTPC